MGTQLRDDSLPDYQPRTKIVKVLFIFTITRKRYRVDRASAQGQCRQELWQRWLFRHHFTLSSLRAASPSGCIHSNLENFVMHSRQKGIKTYLFCNYSHHLNFVMYLRQTGYAVVINSAPLPKDYWRFNL